MVIGASLKPQRYSHRAVIRLNAQNHPVIAVGLREGNIGDVSIITFHQAQEQLETLKQGLDTVTLYLNPQRQEAYYDFIIKLAPKRVIFNPGTENPDFYHKLRAHNIEVDAACTLVLLGTGQY